MAHVGIVQELFDDASQNPTAYENQPRQRLRSWLTDQLDSGNCPGCGWINKDLKIFKLTWKHYGRPGFDEDRVCLFYNFECLVFHFRSYINTTCTTCSNLLNFLKDVLKLS